MAWGVQAFIRKSRRLARSSLVRLGGDTRQGTPRAGAALHLWEGTAGVSPKPEPPALGGINTTLPLALLRFSGPVQSQISQYNPRFPSMAPAHPSLGPLPMGSSQQDPHTHRIILVATQFELERRHFLGWSTGRAQPCYSN